uniref:Uncharacterized protein n=1 Tax=Mesocestoides corti TaxID=53468 RepID=A0A5K3FNV0_MESCO
MFVRASKSSFCFVAPSVFSCAMVRTSTNAADSAEPDWTTSEISKMIENLTFCQLKPGKFEVGDDIDEWLEEMDELFAYTDPQLRSQRLMNGLAKKARMVAELAGCSSAMPYDQLVAALRNEFANVDELARILRCRTYRPGEPLLDYVADIYYLVPRVYRHIPRSCRDMVTSALVVLGLPENPLRRYRHLLNQPLADVLRELTQDPVLNRRYPVAPSFFPRSTTNWRCRRPQRFQMPQPRPYNRMPTRSYRIE